MATGHKILIISRRSMGEGETTDIRSTRVDRTFVLYPDTMWLLVLPAIYGDSSYIRLSSTDDLIQAARDLGEEGYSPTIMDRTGGVFTINPHGGLDFSNTNLAVHPIRWSGHDKKGDT